MPDAPPSERRRPRFSLLNLVLMMTIAAMAIALWRLNGELTPLRAEVRAYRDELGVLTVTDLSLTQAIRVETEGRLSWQWRLRIPPGASYWVNAVGGKIGGGTGVPSRSGAGLLREGEYVITHKIRRDPDKGEQRGSFVVRSVGGQFGRTRISGGTGAHAWVEEGYHVSIPGGVDYSTVSFQPDDVIVLCRHRVSKDSISSAADDLKPGFMIWLSPGP